MNYPCIFRPTVDVDTQRKEEEPDLSEKMVLQRLFTASMIMFFSFS